MRNDKAESVFEEYRYNEKFIQIIRGLLFWEVEPDESRDRKALVLLAKHALNWAENGPQRLSADIKPGFIGFCQSIIDAGPKSKGSVMPEPFTIGISTSL